MRCCSLHCLSWRICSLNTIDLPINQSTDETCHQERLAGILDFQNSNWLLLLPLMLLQKKFRKPQPAYSVLVWKDQIRVFLRELRLQSGLNSPLLCWWLFFALEIHWCWSENCSTLLQRIWLETFQVNGLNPLTPPTSQKNITIVL